MLLPERVKEKYDDRQKEYNDEETYDIRLNQYNSANTLAKRKKYFEDLSNSFNSLSDQSKTIFKSSYDVVLRNRKNYEKLELAGFQLTDQMDLVDQALEKSTKHLLLSMIMCLKIKSYGKRFLPIRETSIKLLQMT